MNNSQHSDIVLDKAFSPHQVLDYEVYVNHADIGKFLSLD